MLICLALVGGLLLQLSLASKIQEEKNIPSVTVPLWESTKLVSDEMIGDITFWGNMFWGRYIHDWSQASPWGYEYPFLGLDGFQKKSNEYWVTGLECPITNSLITSAEQEEVLKFSCRPEYLPFAARHINAMTLANNHTDNMEEINGFANTLAELKKNNIEYFGRFDNQLDDICKVIHVPFFDQLETPVSVPIAFCGYHWVFGLPTDDQLEVIREYSQQYITIVMPHGGAEYVPVPDQLKTSLYRQMIDLGADMVIGDHPHITQTTEFYNNKLIVYSLGNFLFDQQTSFDVTRSIAVRAKITIPRYIVGERPDFTTDFSLRCTDDSNKVLKKASKQDCDKLVQKAAWVGSVEY